MMILSRRTLGLTVLFMLIACLRPQAIGSHVMWEGDTLSRFQAVVSENGQYRVRWYCELNCVLVQDYNNGGTWQIRGYVLNGTISLINEPHAEMFFGNFVATDSEYNAYGVQSDTYTGYENYFNVQDDGNVVIYDRATDTPIWTPACEFPSEPYYTYLFPFNVANCPT